ncbi:MAG: winged helix DNA-binding domain-containing protein, partial [Thermoplasmata archaeon]|nr:winged helix DNA-binding domain-containing protein [Thermoplasmata archaeon]
MAVLRYLGSRDMPNVYSKLWLDEEEGTFGAKKGSRLIYYLNSGTIPEEANFKVFSDKGGRLGELSEGFVEKLSQGDVFVLGGKSYRFERARGMSLFVTDATGRRPTVPSWTGEMLPRSFDLSVAIGNFRELVGERIAAGDKNIKDWLVEEYHLDESGANSILSYFMEQLAFDSNLPTDDELLVEGHIDSRGNPNMIFHFCFGRRVNDALSRAYAMAFSDKFNINVSVSITDDNFMLTLPKHIPLSGLDELVKEGELVELLERAIVDTEIFKHRFRHCSTRGFMVLRNYKGKEVPVGRQMQRSQKVLRAIKDAKNFPIVKETYSEIMNSVMDLKNASDVIKSIRGGTRKINYSDYKDIPSPFAHNVVLAGMSDIVLMHDRTMLLKELHRKVLERIGGAGTIRPEFESQRVINHFSGKVDGIMKKGDIIPLLRRAGPMELFQRKGRSVYDFSDAEPEELARWCGELLREGKVHSVWAGKSLWVPADMAGNYAAVYRSEGELTSEGKIVLDILDNVDGAVSIKEISKGLAIATEMEWDSATTRKILTILERQYLVAKVDLDRKNYPIWGRLAVKPKGDRKKLMEKVIMGRLELFGPMSQEELAFELKLSEAEIEMVLDRESTTGQLMSGAFTEPYIQYMLAQDYAGLRNLDGGLLIPRDRLNRYWLEKHFIGFDNIDDYFERYGSVGALNDVAARLGLDGLEGWGKLRKDGEVLQGRFWDGSVCFVRKKDAPAFISAYRKEELGKVDKQVLEAIGRNPGSDILKVQDITGLPKDSLKSIIEKLDRNMQIARLPADRVGLDPNFESWSTRNRYYRLKNRRSSRDGKEWLVNRVITAYGPVSLYDIARQVGMRRTEAMEYIKELLGSGKLAEVSVMGSEGQKLYVWKKELDSLARPLTGEEEDEIRILTIFDPFGFHHRNEIRMRFGDAWYYTIYHGPRLVGMMEMWEMSGCLEIRELALDEPELLQKVLEALDNFAEFYRKNYLNVIRFTGALGKGVEELDKKALRAFKKAGYVRSRNWLLKGNVIDLELSDEQFVSYLLWKQHIAPERRFDDVMTGLIELGGFKSDHETGVRVHDPVPLKKLHKNEVVEKGQVIPEFMTYALPEEMGLYKAAKHRKIDKNMKYIVTILDREHKMKWSQIIDYTPLSYTNATQALSGLVSGLHVLRDVKSFHYLTPLFRYGKEEARERVLWLIISSFGIFSAESLSLYTKAEFRMGEIRKMLAKFEKEEKLVKGFLSPDDNTLYWLVKEDLPLLPMKKHDIELVLAPSAYDRLSTYLMPYIRKKFGMGSSFIVISGGDIIGAFGANLRRTELVIRKYVGDDAGWNIIKQYAKSIGRRFKIKEEDEDGMSDEELMDWYDKVSGKHP